MSDAAAAIAEDLPNKLISVDRKFYELLVRVFLTTMRMEINKGTLKHVIDDMPESGQPFSQADVDFMVKWALETVRDRELARLIAQHLRTEPGPHGGLTFVEVMKSVGRSRF